ncbi:MAG: aminodeoxychorismate/anthranilate synthase component II [Lachnospiraceae bacterium]|jgi:anthranilate synthase component 2|nr:aminodeoxychorismate/anthranilate synthase component II [Lachnospiraceae bacterium]MDD4525473.1 aminodeoxychorismate/anthranilate synthase component II [Lachnospiraceae bacterium]
MILLIDNYDSFSYNLYQLIGSIDPDIRVVRNDAMNIDEIRALDPKAIILSPGPGHPEDAGICTDVVRELGARYPILGVCLGHQAICTAYGATVSYAKQLMHGRQSPVTFDESCPIFKGCPQGMPVARYHSLAVIENTLPAELKVTARTGDGEVMAVQHVLNPVFGLQFHPESIMTPDGAAMMKNFLDFAENN